MVINSKSKFKLTVSHFKILETLYALAKDDLYSNEKGVQNILRGELDKETIKYKDLATYGTLISLSGRRICSYITNMIRRNYVSHIYDNETDAMYLKITELGTNSLLEYLGKRKTDYSKKEKPVKVNIVKIKK